MRRETSLSGLLCLLVLTASLVGLLIWLDDTDYTGVGHEFTITATVSSITDESVLVDDIKVEDAHGKAIKWFGSRGNWLTSNHYEMQDNYSEPSFFSVNKHRIGHVYDAAGHPSSIQDLRPGQVVRVTGSIRATKIPKTTQDRAVFTEVTVLN